MTVVAMDDDRAAAPVRADLDLEDLPISKASSFGDAVPAERVDGAACDRVVDTPRRQAVSSLLDLPRVAPDPPSCAPRRPKSRQFTHGECYK